MTTPLDETLDRAANSIIKRILIGLLVLFIVRWTCGLIAVFCQGFVDGANEAEAETERKLKEANDALGAVLRDTGLLRN